MNVFRLRDFDAAAFAASLQTTQGWLVVCLCAEWCGTCREFQGVFAELAVQFPQATWLWLDVEDDSEAVGDNDVENFPTLAIQQGERSFFFGTSMPQIGVVRRLVENALQDPSRALGPLAAAQDFVSRLLKS